MTFVKRGYRPRKDSTYTRWRTTDGSYAVSRSKLPGCRPVWYALFSTLRGWRSIASKHGQPVRYRSRAAAIRALEKLGKSELFF